MFFIRNCKINLDLSGLYLLFSVSFQNTWPQFFSPEKNFRPTPLHNLYTIDQNNFVTLQYLIPTVFLQSWNFALSNNNCTTMSSCGNFPFDSNFRNVMKSFKSPLSYNLSIILSNKHVFFQRMQTFHFERFHIYIIRNSVGIDVFIFRIRTDIR